MSRFGIDYSFDRPDSMAALKQAGVTFVCRYLAGGNGGSKEITAAEARELSRAGIDIVLVWETSAQRAGGGGTAGAPDARAARAQAKAIGMPDDRPIYFAVDFDADPKPGSGVERYFMAVVNVLGVERVGAYAGIKPIRFLFDRKLITYGWQTFAWSGGKWDPRAQLRQVENGVRLAGVDCDKDQALASDFGQWRVGGSPAAAPRRPLIARWYDDPRKVRRVQRHLDWAYRHYDIDPVKGKTMIDGKPGPQFKAQVKDWKHLLGYAKPLVRWATGTHDGKFIDALHHPSILGERARARGVQRRNERRRPKDDRAAMAQRLLDHPRALFGFVSPTGGSARVGLEQTARGEKAFVASPESADTGRSVVIDKRILGFMLDCAELSPSGVQFTCVVNGDHSEDSQHYVGQAVDIGKPVSSGAVHGAARRNGVIVLDEDAFHFHVHT